MLEYEFSSPPSSLSSLIWETVVVVVILAVTWVIARQTAVRWRRLVVLLGVLVAVGFGGVCAFGPGLDNMSGVTVDDQFITMSYFRSPHKQIAISDVDRVTTVAPRQPFLVITTHSGTEYHITPFRDQVPKIAQAIAQKAGLHLVGADTWAR